MSYLCINKSGKTIPVYDFDDSSSLKVIGQIYNREAFVVDNSVGQEGDYASIVFRGPNGNISYGMVNSTGDESIFTSCTDAPYATGYQNDGYFYYNFMFRHSEKIYYGDGSVWGSVAPGMQVACYDDTVGTSHPEWKEIGYIQQNPNKNWVKVDGKGYDHGFVNIGFEDGSLPTTISMYGTW